VTDLTLDRSNSLPDLAARIEAGAFPRGIRIPGTYGKVLVGDALEIAELIELRVPERLGSFKGRATMERHICQFPLQLRSADSAARSMRSANTSSAWSSA
jgi:hypothetical protein